MLEEIAAMDGNGRRENDDEVRREEIRVRREGAVDGVRVRVGLRQNWSGCEKNLPPLRARVVGRSW